MWMASTSISLLAQNCISYVAASVCYFKAVPYSQTLMCMKMLRFRYESTLICPKS